MKRNLDTQILDYDGKPIMDGVRHKLVERKFQATNADGSPAFDTDGKPIVFERMEPVLGDDGKPVVTDPGKAFSFGAAFFRACSMDHEKDKEMTAADDAHLFLLTNKVAGGGVVDLTTEDMALLKERVALAYKRLVRGRVAEFLDADPAPARKSK